MVERLVPHGRGRHGRHHHGAGYSGGRRAAPAGVAGYLAAGGTEIGTVWLVGLNFLDAIAQMLAVPCSGARPRAPRRSRAAQVGMICKPIERRVIRPSVLRACFLALLLFNAASCLLTDSRAAFARAIRARMQWRWNSNRRRPSASTRPRRRSTKKGPRRMSLALDCADAHTLPRPEWLEDRSILEQELLRMRGVRSQTPSRARTAAVRSRLRRSARRACYARGCFARAAAGR